MLGAVPIDAVIAISIVWLMGASNPAQISPDETRARMDAFNRALGVECTHCHVEDRWADDSKPAFATARNMTRMVAEINGRLLAGIGKVTCWSCHGGQVKPSRVPAAAMEAQVARWPAGLPDERKLAMSVYAVTLGVDCEFCHTAGDWKAAEKRPMQVVERMNAMFAEFPKYMPASARTQCWMCHKGSRKPQIEPPPR